MLNASRGLASTYVHIDLDASVTRARTLLAEQRTLTDEKALLSGKATSETETARRRTRVTTIDARLTSIRAEVDALFHARTS